MGSVGIAGSGSVVDGWGVLALGVLWLREVEGGHSKWVVDVAIVSVVVVVRQGLRSGVSGDFATSSVISEDVFHIVSVFLATGHSGVPKLGGLCDLMLLVEASGWIGQVGLEVREHTLEGGVGLSARLVGHGLELARGVEGVESWEFVGRDTGDEGEGSKFHLLIEKNNYNKVC